MNNKYAYTGEPMNTRGEYGERVEVMHRGFRGDADELIPSADGPEVAVFDATFGWQWGGSFEAWADVLDPIEDKEE